MVTTFTVPQVRTPGFHLIHHIISRMWWLSDIDPLHYTLSGITSTVHRPPSPIPSSLAFRLPSGSTVSLLESRHSARSYMARVLNAPVLNRVEDQLKTDILLQQVGSKNVHNDLVPN